jgi:hypothetical protein
MDGPERGPYRYVQKGLIGAQDFCKGGPKWGPENPVKGPGKGPVGRTHWDVIGGRELSPHKNSKFSKFQALFTFTYHTTTQAHPSEGCKKRKTMRNRNPDIPEIVKPGVLLQLRQNRNNRNHFGIVLAISPNPAKVLRDGHYQVDVDIGGCMHTITVYTLFGEIRYSGYPKQRDGYGRVFVSSVFPEPSENTEAP